MQEALNIKLETNIKRSKGDGCVGKLFLSLVVVLSLAGTGVAGANKDNASFQQMASQINADAWVVMDNRTGRIIAERNKDMRYYPASITKIGTAIMALERGRLDDVVTISKAAAATEGSSLELTSGDKLTLRDLLYGIILHSGNDGAAAIAEHISGDENQFAKEMTLFLRTIGARNTNFTNASGLPDDQHYTTASDMAVITRYAMSNPVFRDIAAAKSYDWKDELWSKRLEDHERPEAKILGLSWDGTAQIVNHNRLLTLYEGAIGVKNGFTDEARYTLVGAAQRNGTELIAVALKSENAVSAYQDMAKLLDYGFTVTATETVANEQPVEVVESQAELPRYAGKAEEPAQPVIDPESASSGGNPGILYLLTGILGFIAVSYLVYALRKPKRNVR